MNEVWKDIPNYEGLYQVSNFGNVRSLDREIVCSNGRIYKGKSKILKPTLKKTGYLYVSLSKSNNRPKFDVHRLVALAFLENPGNCPCVNHIDGNKINNNVNNLEWCDYSYNSIHADRLGLSKRTYGETNGMSKLKEIDVLKIKKMINEGIKGREIAKKFNIAESTISLIKHKKLWPHI